MKGIIVGFALMLLGIAFEVLGGEIAFVALGISVIGFVLILGYSTTVEFPKKVDSAPRIDEKKDK